ncbi:MAG TPA: cytochrome c [Alphaproteobacteria bacterium]|nr:cytochrome c [Alphaproteobacteria bacterium]
MRRRHLLKLLMVVGAVLAVAALAGVWWLKRGTAFPPGDADDPHQLALGQKVYAEACASCHGAHLEGQANWRLRKPDGRLPAPPHDFHGHTWRHADAELFGMVKRGISAYAPPGYQTDMMGFAGVLSDEQIWAVIAYIKSAWPPAFRTYQQRVTGGARGRDE